MVKWSLPLSIGMLACGAAPSAGERAAVSADSHAQLERNTLEEIEQDGTQRADDRPATAAPPESRHASMDEQLLDVGTTAPPGSSYRAPHADWGDFPSGGTGGWGCMGVLATCGQMLRHGRVPRHCENRVWQDGPGAPEGSVEIESLEAHHIDAEAVRSDMAASLDQARACYREALMVAPRARGKLRVQLSVRGRCVITPRILRSTLGDALLVRCVADALRGMTNSRATGPGVAVFSLRFEPSGP